MMPDQPVATPEALREWLLRYFVDILGCSPDEVTPDISFRDLGLGSTAAAVLSGELEEVSGREVAIIDLWEYSTIDNLVRHIYRLERFGSARASRRVGVRRNDSGGESVDIAVVGIGCRFPGGVTGPESFWEFLESESSSIGEVPEGRWDLFSDGSPETDAALAATTRWGSFLDTLARFDASFFGISPREAARMDPQQRLLLEVAREAIDHAGITIEQLAELTTGVFVGACAGEYGFLTSASLPEVDAWTGTGAALSIIANRLSYAFDLRGPSMTIDTACSSSLVAVHLATRSLRTGECDAALVGGTNVLLTPAVTRSFDRNRAMAADGRCKTFDAAADGYVRGEGCGVVVLRRLADAVADGDRVLAVIRGSAINQDGHSNGLMAPNPDAQVEVLRLACADAGVEPADVDYVEAHGTGTYLGDPIEARAIGTVYGAAHTAEHPLRVGSVKTNLGHLEAAAGIAGFIKTILTLQNKRIPRSLHFETPNPLIDFVGANLRVVDSATDWPSEGKIRRAAVSSFGFGGTNAHVVVEEGVGGGVCGGGVGGCGASSVVQVVVSGKSVERVGGLAGVVRDVLVGGLVGVGDVVACVNHHRGGGVRFGSVTVPVGSAREGLVAGLGVLGSGVSGWSGGVVGPHEGSCGGGVVFVYSGQGSQWVGMGRRLVVEEPSFVAGLEGVASAYRVHTGRDVFEDVAGWDGGGGVGVVQPLLVAVQLGLTELWRGHGVVPDAVVGHSMGEVTAAVVSGALSVDEGMRVVAVRSRLMGERLAGLGAMAVVDLDVESLELGVLVGFPGVVVAVHASPRQSVVAGSVGDVEALLGVLSGGGVWCERVDVDVASHHPGVDVIVEELRGLLGGVVGGVPGLGVFSSTGGVVGVPRFDGEHWVANVRGPVLFREAIEAAAEGHSWFVEVSPHPVLTVAVEETLRVRDERLGWGGHRHVVGTLRRGGDEVVDFHVSHARTCVVVPPVVGHPVHERVVVPSAPWVWGEHWFTPPERRVRTDAHPLLGSGLADPTRDRWLWENDLHPDLLWLSDHRVGDVCVLPATCHAELALAAAREAFPDMSAMIERLDLEQILPVRTDTRITTVLTGTAERCTVEIYGCTTDVDDSTGPRVRQATADLVPYDGRSGIEIDTARSDPGPDPEELYERLRQAHQQHGPAFRGIRGLRTTAAGDAIATVELPPAARPSSRRFLLHPVMADIAMQALAATATAGALADRADRETAVLLPTRIDGLVVLGDVTTGTTARASLTAESDSADLVGRVELVDEDGRPVLVIERVRTTVLRARPTLGGMLYGLQWQPTERETAPAPDARILVVSEAPPSDPLIEQLSAALESAGALRVDRCAVADIGRHSSAADDPYTAVVHVPASGSDAGDPSVAVLELVETVTAVARLSGRRIPRLWVLTQMGSQVDSGAAIDLSVAGMRGAVRTLVFEQPGLRICSVDTDIAGISEVAIEVMSDERVDELAFRDGMRFVRRLQPVPMNGDTPQPETRTTVIDTDLGDSYRIVSRRPGDLEALTAVACPRPVAGPRQVCIRVTRTGMNFSDVLKAMGVYPGSAADMPLGGECVGVVESVGSEVTDITVGERVVAIGLGALGAHMVTDRDLVVALPENLEDGAAAGLPVAYLTAWRSLIQVGGLGAGDRVLIHSATGGVGRAAIAIAHRAGALVYATAGTAEKRATLRELGVHWVGDSRTLDFADDILAETGGVGVDVVLNSLTGAALQRSLATLRAGGHFVEIGKKDVFGGSAISLATLAGGGSFTVVDLERDLFRSPGAQRALFESLIDLVATGELPPLPTTDVDAENVTGAFRTMAAARHNGKVVVRAARSGPISVAAPRPTAFVRPECGYLISGGLGGLGLVVARHLLDRGAGMVVVNGRSEPTPELRAELDTMPGIRVVTGDIADPATAQRMVEAVQAADLRVGGVIHAAMVLRDQTALNVTADAVAEIFRPKIEGARHLHEATAALSLDWWVAFSSAASMLGAPGQLAYAAANSWLDAFVARLRADGLPAIGLNWGPWASVGRARDLGDRGFALLSVEQGLEALELAIAADRGATAVIGLDVRRWFQTFPSLAESSLFGNLGAEAVTRAVDGDLIAAIEKADPADRPALVEDMLADEIVAVIGAGEPIDRAAPLASMGLDSLMALEIRNRVEARLGDSLPVALMWAHPTVGDLARGICEHRGWLTDPPAESGPGAAAPDLSTADLDLISEVVGAGEQAALGGSSS